MTVCRTLIRTSFSSKEWRVWTSQRAYSLISPSLGFSLSSVTNGLREVPPLVASRCYASIHGALSTEDEPHSSNSTREDPTQDNVEHLLTNPDEVTRLMKMERRSIPCVEGDELNQKTRWFPYCDRFKCEGVYVTSSEILEAVSPCIFDVRKERFRNVVNNRSYSVCLVVEGLSDFGNVSAAFRSADALGLQSVHVVSCDSSKRC